MMRTLTLSAALGLSLFAGPGAHAADEEGGATGITFLEEPKLGLDILLGAAIPYDQLHVGAKVEYLAAKPIYAQGLVRFGFFGVETPGLQAEGYVGVPIRRWLSPSSVRVRMGSEQSGQGLGGTSGQAIVYEVLSVPYELPTKLILEAGAVYGTVKDASEPTVAHYPIMNVAGGVRYLRSHHFAMESGKEHSSSVSGWVHVLYGSLLPASPESAAANGPPVGLKAGFQTYGFANANVELRVEAGYLPFAGIVQATFEGVIHFGVH